MQSDNRHYCRAAIFLSCDHFLLAKSGRRRKQMQWTRSGACKVKDRRRKKLNQTKATRYSRTKERSVQKKTLWETKEVTSQLVCAERSITRP